MNFLKRFKKAEDGFTMTELALVIAVAAIMMVPLYTVIFYVSQVRAEDNRFEMIQKALGEHLRVTGTLPCPAGLALDIDSDPSAFVAGDCSAVAGSIFVDGQTAIGAVPIDTLRAAMGCSVPDGFVFGFTDDVMSALRKSMYNLREAFTGTSKNTFDHDGNPLTPEIEVGSYRAQDDKCLPREFILDEYGSKFIYAVSVNATVPGFDVFDPEVFVNGVRIFDAGGVAGGELVKAYEQPYALVSVGADRKGGYQRDGVIRGIACGAVSSALDNENCNYDRDFVIAPHANVQGARYFDDHVEYGIAGFVSEDSFWRWGGDGGGGRDMILNEKSRLLLDPDTGGMDPEDALFVNRGGARVRDDLRVGPDLGGGGQLISNDTVEVRENANARSPGGGGGNVTAPKFCYDPPLVPGDC